MHIFGPFDDIIVYIDNTILFTKESFEHHVERLACVLELLHKNNLHVHVEETFLASDKVDYLGYTLTMLSPQASRTNLSCEKSLIWGRSTKFCAF